MPSLLSTLPLATRIIVGVAVVTIFGGASMLIAMQPDRAPVADPLYAAGIGAMEELEYLTAEATERKKNVVIPPPPPCAMDASRCEKEAARAKAVATQDPNDCDVIGASGAVTACQAEVFFKKALATNNPALCERIPLDDARTRCRDTFTHINF